MPLLARRLERPLMITGLSCRFKDAATCAFFCLVAICFANP